MKTDEELRLIADQATWNEQEKMIGKYGVERRALYNAGLRDAAKVCDNTGPDDWTGENCAAAIRALIKEPK